MKTVLSCLLVLGTGTGGVLGAVDDFDDGNLDGWTSVDPLNGAGVAAPTQFTFPDGAVRMRAPVPAVDAAGPARGFLFRDGETFSDFYAAVDLVSWNDEIDQAFGLFARAGSVGLGTTTGYVCNYNPNQNDSTPGGQFQINRVRGEAEDGTLASANVKLVSGRTYRLVFTGAGDVLTGALYDVEDLSVPIALIQVESDDGAEYASGGIGIFNFYRGNPTDPDGIADLAFDNFESQAAVPSRPAWPSVRRGIAGGVNVVERVPASGANFYAAGGGIGFRVSRLGQGPVTGVPVSLVIDGFDVSADLDVVEDDDDLLFRYEVLEANRRYEVRITAGNTVEVFEFDTFELGKVADGTFLQIEAEDYDYDDGMFQNDPPPSGFGSAGQVNGNGVGYFDLEGVIGTDYEDFDGAVANENDYRFFDFVGLRAGSDDVQPFEELATDTLRPKYVAAGVPDYEVFRTEPGEWLNYTRDFAAGDYQVFLRAASREAQDVILLEVGAGGTVGELGRFMVPNLVSPQRHRFVPLVDENLDPAVLGLGGETTLRLLIGGEEFDFDTRYTLYLNYLMLVPAEAGGDTTLRVTGVVRGDGVFSLTWASVPGADYVIEYSVTGDAGSWQEVEDAEAEGASLTFSERDAGRLAASEGYYRVRRVD